MPMVSSMLSLMRTSGTGDGVGVGAGVGRECREVSRVVRRQGSRGMRNDVRVVMSGLMSKWRSDSVSEWGVVCCMLYDCDRMSDYAYMSDWVHTWVSECRESKWYELHGKTRARYKKNDGIKRYLLFSTENWLHQTFIYNENVLCTYIHVAVHIFHIWQAAIKELSLTVCIFCTMHVRKHKSYWPTRKTHARPTCIWMMIQ